MILDTCALLALARGRLPDDASAALSLAPDAHVSVVSSWEVAIKAAQGKLQLDQSPFQWFGSLTERYDLREITSMPPSPAQQPPCRPSTATPSIA